MVGLLFFRLLLNIALRGIGTLTYLKKFGFDLGKILTSIVQFFGGEFFFITLDIAMGGECKMDAYRKLFYEVLSAICFSLELF